MAVVTLVRLLPLLSATSGAVMGATLTVAGIIPVLIVAVATVTATTLYLGTRHARDMRRREWN